MFQGIVGHVVLAIVMWLMSFTVVLWSIYLKGRVWRGSYHLAIAGAILVTVSVFTGSGKAIVNNYVPTIDDPLFFFGIGFFFAAFAINGLSYLASAIYQLRSKEPLKCAISFSVLIGLLMMISLCVSLLLGSGQEVEPRMAYFEKLFWIPGHIQQVLNGALLIAVWYALRSALGLPNHDRVWLRPFNWMLLLSALVLFIIPFVTDPVSRNAKIGAEIIYGVGLGIPVFVHAINILIGLSKAKGNFSGVVFLSLVLSMAIYFLGIAIAYTGLGNDTRVPAHYHGAVTGLTLAMMGLTYTLVRSSAGAKGVLEKFARIQPVLYGAGMILVILGLMVSGMFGAPRKTYGVAFASDPLVLTALTVMGIGTLMAVFGGVLFVSYSGIKLLGRREF